MKDSFETVVVGSDFSEESDVACRYAARIARLCNARLLLFHAFHVAQGDMMDERGRKMHFEDAKERVHGRLEEIVSKQMDDYPRCAIEVRLGHPAQELIKYVADVDADLVVVATGSRSRLKKQLMGSTADEVARSVACPTLIVPPDAS